MERLAQQEQAAVDAFVSRLEELPAPGEGPPSDLHERALKAFVGKACEYLRGALVTDGDGDPIARADGLPALFALDTMWGIYTVASIWKKRGFDAVEASDLGEEYRRLHEGRLHAAAEEKGLYSIVAQLLDPAKGALEVRRQCLYLVNTMIGDHEYDLDPSMINHLARSGLVEASNGRIGSLLLATLDDPAIAKMFKVEALRALATFTRGVGETADLSNATLEQRVSTVLAADEKIEVLLRMFGDETVSERREWGLRRIPLMVLSNVLHYTNAQTETSPLIKQILERNMVTTMTEQFKPGRLRLPWLNRKITLAFLRQFLYALYMADAKVVERAFQQFKAATFVRTMLAHWKTTYHPSDDYWLHIGRLFELFGRMDERYKKSQKWQRALIDNGVYDYLETALKKLDASLHLHFQSTTAHINLLKYTLLPIPELWARAKDGGLLDWMIDAATAEAPHFDDDAMKNQHTLHSVLSEIAARDSGVAEWLLSNNREGTRRDRLLHCWAPKQYGPNIVAYGYASGFRALLCHGVAFDLVTMRNAQRVSGASVYTLPEGSEQWDWYAVEYILKDPNIIELAAVQGPAPSTGAAILMTLHILDVLSEDSQATMFEGPEGEKPEDKLVRRNTKWAELLHQFQTLHVGNGQLAGQLNKLINLVTELLQNPGPSNSAYILSQRQSEVWEAQEVPEQPTKRPRVTTTTDAVYARFLDLAQLRFPN